MNLSIIQQAGLAICLNEELLHEEDLTDEYLRQLGFGDDNENYNFSQFDEDEQDVPSFKEQQLVNQNNSNREITINSSHKVTYTQNISPQVQNYNEQDYCIVKHSSERIMSYEMEEVQKQGQQESQVKLQFEHQKQTLAQHQSPIQLIKRNEFQKKGSELGTTTPQSKKGILKKSTFQPAFAAEVEGVDRQRSNSEESEKSQKARQSSHQRINRRKGRHVPLSFKYDKVNQFLSKTKGLDAMMSMKSMKSMTGGDNDLQSMKSSKGGGKLKQQVLDRQHTLQTQHHYIEEQFQQDDQNQTLHIKEDAVRDLDRNKQFEIYFPLNNLDNVLQQVSALVRKTNHHFTSVTQTQKKTKEKSNLVKEKLRVSSYLQLKRLNMNLKSYDSPVINENN